MGKKTSPFSQAAAAALEETADVGSAKQPFTDRMAVLQDAGDRVSARLRRVDPAECRMWEYHNRDYAHLTEENCRDLIDSIVAQGGQEQPAIVRPLKGEGARYEVIAGARRHFAISWLREHNYPQMKYYVEVRDLEDEECFRLSDLENRNRKDISDYERALDYRGALERYYNTQQEMARRLNVPENWLSRFLLLANLPKEIVGAYADIHDLKLRHARDLSPLLKTAAGRKKIIAAASELASQHEADKAAGAKPMLGPQVFQQLVKAGRPKTKGANRAPIAEYRTKAGKPMLAINANTKNTMTIVIDRRGDADIGDLQQAFEKALKEHY